MATGVFQAHISELRKHYTVSELRSGHCLPSRPGTNTAATATSIDRFTCSTSLCRKTIDVQIILNTSAPSVPPDFVLPKGEEFSISISQLKSYKSWSPKQPKSLVDIVSEIFTTLKEQQRKLVLEFPNQRSQFECSTVQELPGVEFALVPQAHDVEIRCSIPLALPELKKHCPRLYASVVSASHSQPPTEPSATLLVTFLSDAPATRRPDTAVVMSDLLEHALGQPLLPIWGGEMCLVDYVPALQGALRELIAEYVLRRSFLEGMIAGFGSALEYDSISYRRIVFFIDDKATPMICSFTLPAGFPREKIALSIQSPFLARLSRTIARSVPGLPWSSKWTPEEFVKKAKDYLKDVRAEFQKVLEMEVATEYL